MKLKEFLEPVAEYNLTRQEVARGALGGFRRWMKSEHLKNRAGYKPTPFRDLASATHGAIAEVAAAKWLGIPLDRLKIHEGTYKTVPDLEPDIEVRWSSGTGLVIRPHEEGIIHRRFILVTTSGPGLFEIWGWALGKHVWRQKFLSRPNPSRDECYELPKDLLIRSIP